MCPFLNHAGKRYLTVLGPLGGEKWTKGTTEHSASKLASEGATGHTACRTALACAALLAGIEPYVPK